MDQEKIKSIIESLLFLSGEPIKISKIAKIIGIHQAEAENAIMVLSTEFESANRGLRLMKNGQEVQLVTDPGNAEFTEQLVKGELQESLSPAALEVLAIVVYKGPITRANIESIRGVNSSFTLRNLLLRGLIGREENPKDARSYVYQATFDFLRHMGIEDVKKLPDYESLSGDARIENITEAAKVK